MLSSQLHSLSCVVTHCVNDNLMAEQLTVNVLFQYSMTQGCHVRVSMENCEVLLYNHSASKLWLWQFIGWMIR